MKRYSFFLALAIFMVSFGLAQAGMISVDTTLGLFNYEVSPGVFEARLVANAPVSYNIRYDNSTGSDCGGITNGYRVWSSDGSSFGAISMEVISTYDFAAEFDLIWGIVAYADDDGDDTIRAGGSKGANGSGLIAGHNDVDFQITVANGVDSGIVLCIDSSWYPPTGVWKWVNDEGPPDWGGPYCYEAEIPACMAPIVTNLVDPYNTAFCTPYSYQFTAVADENDGSGADPSVRVWSVDVGTIDQFGNWQWAPGIGDVGANTVTVTVGNGECENNFSFTANVGNEAPVLTCPAGLLMTTGSKEFDITATDADGCQDLTFSVVSFGDLDGASFTDNMLTITEGTSTEDYGSDYYITFEVTDGAATVTCVDVLVEVLSGSDYQVVIGCIGEPSGPVYQGQTVDVPVDLIAAVDEIGGFDFLIAYDNSALSFQSASFVGDYAAEWEYLTYRFGANGNCTNACPTGLLRVVGIAETNNGADHPTFFGIPTPNTMFTLKFLVTNDRTFECQNIPLRFYWTDCGDNTLSNRDGTVLFLSDAIYDGYDPSTSNGYQDIYDPTYGFPTYFGAFEDCYFDEKGEAIAAVSFTNGCVFIACADEIDARGDINMNNVANEVADAVLYSRYFIYGIGVFDSYMQGQIAASDVNADGIALSVADLVYLIRIVIGDALPYPKLAPTATVVTNTDGLLNVKDAMGAAVVSVEGNVVPVLLSDNMEMIYNYDEVSNTTRTLVYSMDANNTFSGSFLNANGNVTSIELATYEGATVTAKLIPGNFDLDQNYPNPFNPTTMLAFSIPFASDVTLTIYNITGQKVTEFSGAYEAGVHNIEWDASNQASGIYFYKLSAGNFEMTKKMVLLK